MLEIALADNTPALAALDNLDPPFGAVAVVEPTAAVYSEWRSNVSLDATIFIGTSAILLVILYGYFAQVRRASEADGIYSATEARSETALMRGRCGLWDWDLARGRLFWSRSMFELLGLEPRDALLGYGEVSRLIHPDDGDLMKLVEAMFGTGETTVDRMFRMHHADGRWVWLRARAELVDPSSAEPHLIGIAVDITEQMRLVERSKTADIRLRDAIETVSEAFVLWDSENRLVMCNSKYQQLHGIPDGALVSGTPYAEVIAAGRKPLVRSQVVAEGKPEDGGRSFELQLEDGRWLQINERRTKDGGFVSVGTDITQLKRHEGRLIEGERRLMATIADLRQSRQKLEQQAQQMVEPRREIRRGEGPRRGRQPDEIRIPRQHQPRAAHPAQRRHRLLRDHGVGDVRPARLAEIRRVLPGHPPERHLPARRHQRRARHVAHRGRPHAAPPGGNSSSTTWWRNPSASSPPWRPRSRSR